MSLEEFIYMDGHGFFVWTSYAIGLISFVALYLATKLRNKALLKQIKRSNRQQQRELKQG